MDQCTSADRRSPSPDAPRRAAFGLAVACALAWTGGAATMIAGAADKAPDGAPGVNADADAKPAAEVEAAPIHRIAEAHGFDRWDKVEAVRFTFNVRRGRSTRPSRRWQWRPGDNAVRLTVADAGAPGGERVVEYDRDELAGAAKRVIDADRKFINDSFWLLLPLHLSWADDVEVEDKGMHALPIGEGEARRVVVRYPKEEGGYTPGDRYDLYVDKDWRIVQWTFHRGGGDKPNLATTWEGYAKAGPLALSLNRRNPEADLAITFPNTAVKLEGGEGWLEAERVDVDEKSRGGASDGAGE